jgi:hypothetical protein
MDASICNVFCEIGREGLESANGYICWTAHSAHILFTPLLIRLSDELSDSQAMHLHTCYLNQVSFQTCVWFQEISVRFLEVNA